MSSTPNPTRAQSQARQHTAAAQKARQKDNKQNKAKKQHEHAQPDYMKHGYERPTSTGPRPMSAQETELKAKLDKRRRLVDNLMQGKARKKRSDYIDQEIAHYRKIGTLPVDKFLYLDALAVEEPVHPEELEARYIFYGGANIFRQAVARLKAKNKPRIITNIDEEIRYVSNQNYLKQIETARDRAVEVLERQFFDDEVKKLQSIGKLPDDEDELKEIKDETYYHLKEAMLEFRRDPDLGVDHGVLDLDATEAQIDHFLGRNLTVEPPISLLEKMGIEDPHQELLRKAEYGNQLVDELLLRKAEREGFESFTDLELHLMYNNHNPNMTEGSDDPDGDDLDFSKYEKDGKIDVQAVRDDYIKALPVLSEAKSLTHLRSMLSGDLHVDPNKGVMQAGEMPQSSSDQPSSFSPGYLQAKVDQNKELNILQRLKMKEEHDDYMKQLQRAAERAKHDPNHPSHHANQPHDSSNKSKPIINDEDEYPDTTRLDVRNAIQMDKMIDAERKNLYFDMEWHPSIENVHEVKRYNVPPIWSDELKPQLRVKRRPDWKPDELVTQTEAILEDIQDRLKQQRKDNERPSNREFFKAWAEHEHYDWPKAKDIDFNDPRWVAKFYNKPHMEGDFEVFGDYEKYLYPEPLGQQKWHAMHSHLPKEERYMERFRQTFLDQDYFQDAMLNAKAFTDDHLIANENIHRLDDHLNTMQVIDNFNERTREARELNQTISPGLKFNGNEFLQEVVKTGLQEEVQVVDHRYMNMVKEVMPNFAANELSEEEKDQIGADMTHLILYNALAGQPLSPDHKHIRDELSHQFNDAQENINTLRKIHHPLSPRDKFDISQLQREGTHTGNNIYKESNLDELDLHDIWVEPPQPQDSVEKQEFKRLLHNRLNELAAADQDQDYRNAIMESMKKYDSQFKDGAKISSKATEAVNNAVFSSALRDISDFHPSMKQNEQAKEEEERYAQNSLFDHDLKETIPEEQYNEYRHQYPYREQYTPRQNEIITNMLQQGLQVPTQQKLDDSTAMRSHLQFGPQNLLLKSQQLNNLHLYGARNNSGQTQGQDTHLSQQDLDHINHLTQLKQDLLSETMKHIENKRIQRIIHHWTKDNQSLGVLRHVLKNIDDLDEEFDRLPNRQNDLVYGRANRQHWFNQLQGSNAVDHTLHNSLNNPTVTRNSIHDLERFGHDPALVRTPQDESQLLGQQELRKQFLKEPSFGITTFVPPPQQEQHIQQTHNLPSPAPTQSQRSSNQSAPPAYQLTPRDMNRAKERLQAHADGRLSQWESEQRLNRVKLREHLHGRSPKHSMEVNKHFTENLPLTTLQMLSDNAVSSKLFEKYTSHYNPPNANALNNSLKGPDGLTQQERDHEEELRGDVAPNFHSHQDSLQNLSRGSSEALKSLEIPESLAFPHSVVKDLIQTAQERLIFAFDRNKSRFYAARQEYFDNHDIEHQRQELMDKLIQTHNHYVDQQQRLQRFLSEKKNLHNLIQSKTGLTSMKNVLAQQLYSDIHNYFQHTTGQERNELMNLANNYDRYLSESNLSSILSPNPSLGQHRQHKTGSGADNAHDSHNSHNSQHTSPQTSTTTSPPPPQPTYLNQDLLDQHHRPPSFLQDLLNKHKPMLQSLSTYAEQRRFIEDEIWKAREAYLDKHLQQLPQKIIDTLFSIQNLLSLPRPQLITRKLNRIAKLGNQLSQQYKAQESEFKKSINSILEKLILMKLLTTSGGVLGLLRNFFTQFRNRMTGTQQQRGELNQSRQRHSRNTSNSPANNNAIVIDSRRNPFTPQQRLFDDDGDDDDATTTTTQPVFSNASLFSTFLTSLTSTSLAALSPTSVFNSSPSSRNGVPSIMTYASSLLLSNSTPQPFITTQRSQFAPSQFSGDGSRSNAAGFTIFPSAQTFLTTTPSPSPSPSSSSIPTNTLRINSQSQRYTTTTAPNVNRNQPTTTTNSAGATTTKRSTNRDAMYHNYMEAHPF